MNDPLLSIALSCHYHCHLQALEINCDVAGEAYVQRVHCDVESMGYGTSGTCKATPRWKSVEWSRSVW